MKFNDPGVRIFQLRFGAFRSGVNRCDIIATNIFDDDISDSTDQGVEQPLGPSAAASFSSTSGQLPSPHADENIATPDILTPASFPVAPSSTPSEIHTKAFAGARRKLDFEKTISSSSHSPTAEFQATIAGESDHCREEPMPTQLLIESPPNKK